jgi:hypothetical protein
MSWSGASPATVAPATLSPVMVTLPPLQHIQASSTHWVSVLTVLLATHAKQNRKVV